MTEFRLAQTDIFEKVPQLLTEKIPIVIQPFAAPHQLWTHQDILQRASLQKLPIPNLELTLGSALQEKGKMIPWSPEFGQQVASVTGIPVWTAQTIKPLFQKHSLLSMVYSYDTEV